MHIDQFDYALPERLIAQEPPPERDLSRLMLLRRDGSPPTDHIFRDLPWLLNSGDLLVLNDTRVLPARLIGRRARTGGKWEGLFLREEPDGAWELLTQTRGRLLGGETVLVDPEIPSSAPAPLSLRLAGKSPLGRWLVRPEETAPVAQLLARYGRTPLPPYIRKGRAAPGDRERYQTVFAHQAGAVAAPTAGLHFTPQLFDRLRERGIERTFVTLHVGAGTFQPVTVEDVTQHRVQPEWGEMPAATAEAVAACKQRGGRVVAVGTTSVRVLETAARTAPGPWSGWTDLTIRPPFRFRLVDALVTNFHLPRSSLLLLVAAFAG
ncbi:MAG TPA: tRNA preQ1(34) S-adenosylmethionine ribosyltransferase-isomerase QueA, partial [Gemmataceae bacterium]|nr:tRNA preQ1(34) S-adenosylmethionine ribosyltransferase-isomerase QueA [Gemmataceae bacterium]